MTYPYTLIGEGESVFSEYSPCKLNTLQWKANMQECWVAQNGLDGFKKKNDTNLGK